MIALRPVLGLGLAALTASALMVAATTQVHAQSTTQTLTYTGDFATVFPNPDRGFHNRYEIINDPNVNQYVTSSSPAGGFDPDQVDRTFSRAKAAGDTLIHSYVHLDMYQTSPLPQELLDNLSSGLAAIRAAGMKIVLRFAYVWDSYPNVSEAQIEAHIAQLAPVLNANAGVIDHFEAGFLGMWGEWHDSAYTDPFSQSEAASRYRVLLTELDDFPASVPIAIRYPIFNYEFQQMAANPPAGCTLPNNCMPTRAQLDRLGFHDDCFLADSADQGTYDQNSWLGWYDTPTKKQWVYDTRTSFGGNQEVGGESCNASGGDDAAGVNAQYEMSHQHWTEINEDYAPVNTNIWKAANLPASGNDPAETLFNRMQRKLGYRLRLVDATVSDTATPGSAFAFAAHLSNDGYAAPVQQRPVYLVFDNGTNRYNIPLSGLDPRTWMPGAVTVPTQAVTLPANMAPGTYALALWLPDQSQALWNNPAYDIRLANTGTWNATTGYNTLATGVTVGAACTGSCTAPSTPATLASPSQTSGSISLSWGGSTDNAGVAWYQVFRDGTQVATTASTSYTDANLSAATSHTYTVAAVGADGNVSAVSSPLTASTTAAGDFTPPTVPGLMSATGETASSVTLSWNASTDEVAVAGYRIYRNGTQVGTAGATATTYTDTGLTPSTTYTYTVKAFDPAGNLSNPALVTATTGGSSGGGTTPPTVPTGLSSTGQTSTSISLSWTASTDSSSPVAGYDIYRNGTKVGTSTSTSFTDTGLSPSTSYSYTVDAYDPAGNVSAASAALAVSTTATGVSGYQAESPANTLAGGAIVQACSACSGGQKVGYIGNGGTLTFNQVTASSAGSHTLTVYYVDGDAGRSGVVTVNGTATTLSFHGTNDSNWNFVQSLTVTVTLNSGSNTIRFSNPSGWAPDIDQITV
jgi:chitodextrinase